ncbi:MAG: hypothetical protein V1918_06470 [Planctomycetota bacterium]
MHPPIVMIPNPTDTNTGRTQSAVCTAILRPVQSNGNALLFSLTEL